jgi:uncharacterized protein YecE (DUF72 family)
MADAVTRAGAIRIGISGWTYPPWRGAFYPKGLPQRCELAHASAAFRSIEINGTFYGMQTPSAFAHWADATPDGFVFAVKGPRFVTHMLRLRHVETPVANFIASGLLRLGAKLGPVLWQLPPTLRFDRALIGDFLALLPHDRTPRLTAGRRGCGRGRRAIRCAMATLPAGRLAGPRGAMCSCISTIPTSGGRPTMHRR